MAEKSFIISLIAGLLIVIVGVLGASLGIGSIINNALSLNAWIIIFGLLLLNAGIACVAGGIGHIFLRKWSSRVAFYGSLVVILISLAGVLHLGGFVIKSLYAVIVMIVAMWAMWYSSKRELGAFFLISVAEHVFVIIIVIMLIYSGPIEIIKSEDAVAVTLEEMKPEEKEPPLIKLPSPKKPKEEKKVNIPEKKQDTNKPVEPPKLQIKMTTNLDQGSNTMASLPKLPKTFADTLDRSPGRDAILRSPGPEDNFNKRATETVTIPDKGISTAFKGVRSTSDTGVVSPFESGKGKGGTAAGRETVYSPGSPSFSTESKGTTTGAARPGFIGDIRGEVAGRKVVWWPKLPEEVKGTEGGSATLEITVDPAGNVTKVKIIVKSGSPKLDRIAIDYVGQIRFEQLPKNVQQKTQRGEIAINFELAR